MPGPSRRARSSSQACASTRADAAERITSSVASTSREILGFGRWGKLGAAFVGGRREGGVEGATRRARGRAALAERARGGRHHRDLETAGGEDLRRVAPGDVAGERDLDRGISRLVDVLADALVDLAGEDVLLLPDDGDDRELVPGEAAVAAPDRV